MTDVDALLRSSLRQHAEDAPIAVDLLAAVHDRARRHTRRRRFAGSVVAVLSVALAGPVFAAAAQNLPRPAATGNTAASVAPSTSPTPVVSPSASPTSGSPPASDAPLRLVPPAYATPVFPFQPDITPTGGLAPPVVTLVAGELSAYYAANDPVAGADVTIRVGPRPPTFDSAADRAGPVVETDQQVRGHPARLRRVRVTPANRLSLYWLEKPGQWVRVDTDDTLTDAQVVALADALAPATVPVLAPFHLDLVPAGMELDTSTRSVLAFRPRGGSDVVSYSLVAHQTLTGPTLDVGGHRATIRHTGGAAVLTVELDGWPAALVVRVPARYPVNDADLIRLGGGVHLTDTAEPQP